MKITINEQELAEIEALLPASVKELIIIIGYSATARLISRFGGVTFTSRNGMAKERTGGVHAMLREVLTDDEANKLTHYVGADQFYIPRCDAAFRILRNARFIASVAARQAEGMSLRQTMAALCPEFGISDRQGWKLLRGHCGNSGFVQSALF